MNVLELFAGAGGGILGGLMLGHRPVCAVELDPYCRRVLIERQNDGVLPSFPVWDDMRTFDGRPWAGLVDIVSGGFPCQDISPAGGRAGIDGEKSGLWSEFARVVREIRPRFVFLENAADLAIRGLDRVLEDLHLCGFDAEWDTFGACSVGAIHHRHRLFCLAQARELAHADRHGQHVRAEYDQVAGIRAAPGRTNTNGKRRNAAGQQVQAGGHGPVGRAASSANANSERGQSGAPCPRGQRAGRSELGRGGWWGTEPGMARLADGMADRVDRARALGNGQVPAVHALAFRVLAERLGVVD